jgi:hypothetical protein
MENSVMATEASWNRDLEGDVVERKAMQLTVRGFSNVVEATASTCTSA